MLTIRFDRLGVQAGDLVLDAGAGFGRHAFELARQGANVVALDYATDEVAGTRATFAAMAEAGEIAEERFAGGLQGDATRLPFADNSFDRVITSEVLEHIQADTAAITEFVRVLKPGGTFAATVPTWLPEKINWMLSDEYHAPKSVGGHVRIYTATELKAKLRSAGLAITGSHRTPSLHSPYWWLKCAVGVRRDDHRLVQAYKRLLEWEITRQPRGMKIVERATSPVLGKSYIVYARKGGARETVENRAKTPAEKGAKKVIVVPQLPDIHGVISAEEIVETAEWIASLQLDTGMIPWFPGGHCDPWNHVETTMALDVAGFHAAAERGYEWLVDVQRDDGSWWNYYLPDGTVEEAKLDTNVCAYLATGVWHHWLCTWDRAFVDHLWPTVQRALDWVLSMRREDGTVIWACTADDRPWNYALLTGSSSIAHALRCGANLAALCNESRPDWVAAADRLCLLINEHPRVFEPKDRWAMDWYYPVLAGCLTGERAKVRLADGWSEFAMEHRGIRCVSDEPWITASETAECAIAHAAIGDIATAMDLVRWTRRHRRHDGAYYTGIVYPGEVHFPFEEVSAYTGAAVILAADAIDGASPANGIFVPRCYV